MHVKITPVLEFDEEDSQLRFDEASRRLFVAEPSALRVIAVDTPRGRFHARVYPALRTWALVQAGRARPARAAPPAAAAARAADADAALERLLQLPVAHVLGRVLRFAYP